MSRSACVSWYMLGTGPEIAGSEPGVLMAMRYAMWADNSDK